MTRTDPGSDACRRNESTVREFLRLLEAGDIDTWIELWAENAFQFYPFGTEMFPAQLRGRDAVYALWKTVPESFDRLCFVMRRTWAVADMVISQFDGDCVLTGGERYRNSYLAIFRFTADGRIREYWEYFDPIVAGVRFGLAKVSYPE